MNFRLLVSGALLCLLVPGAPIVAGASGRAVEITVDAGSTLGPVPRLFLPSVFASWADGGVLARFGSEFQRLGMVRLSVESFVSESRDLHDYARRIRALDGVATEIARRGGEVVLTIARTPRWLASKPESAPMRESGWRAAEASPPRDFDLWGEMVAETVRHFNGRLGLDVLYEFWNEPDLRFYWQGTEEDFFRLYRAFVLGARRADAKARIGGPTVSAWDRVLEGPPRGSSPMLRNFIKYAATTPLPEMGMAKLPLDFVVWHEYGAHLSADWENAARQVRDWLTESGYPRKTLLVVDEWALGSAWETEREAAYWLASMFWMRQAGLDRQTVASLPDFFFDKRWEGLSKPVYNAMRLSARLESRLLPSRITAVSSTSRLSTIEALAAGGEGRVTILTVSYPSDPRHVAWRFLTQRGYRDPADLRLTTAALQAFVEGRNVEPRGGQWSRRELEDLETARGVYQAQKLVTRASTAVQLEVLNLPFRPVCVERYGVDSTVGNGPAAYAGAKARGWRENDALAAARAAETLGPVEARTLGGRGIVHRFSLEPYSIGLVVLSRPNDGRCS